MRGEGNGHLRSDTWFNRFTPPNFVYDCKIALNVFLSFCLSSERIFRADDLAWFCPSTDECCEWECCAIVNKEVSEFDAPDEGLYVNID